jgi:pimeloyl-ACP methyl ester carboxylesterase
VIPLSTIQNAQSISAASVNLSTEITFAPPPRFGPRIWNGSVWLDYPQGFDPNKKTLVLTHGILSTVEDSFGGSVSELMSQGGYTQVIGFNYDYARNNMVEAGQKFADFLNSLQTEGGLTQIDLQAHSFGTLVALYAASQTDLAINNMILLGGPLDGTPAADLAGPGLLTLLANYAPDNPYATTTTFKDVLESGMFLDAQTGNPLLKTIRTNAINRHPNTNYIKIFGSKSMWGSIVTEFLFDTAPNDGMVPASESVGDDLPGPTYIVSEEHDKLQSNSDVQQFVGANLISALPPITGDVTGYWTGTINNPNLGIYGCNGGLSYFSISLSEDAGSISGSYGSVSVSGNRSEYALSINADTSFGNRSYSWTWDGGDTLTGSVAYYCWSDDTGALLKEGSGTFTVTR